jgi:glycerol kinase
MKAILALDQGTTSSRAILFDRAGRILGLARRPIKQIYPRPGWVEQNPLAIWKSQLTAARVVLSESGVAPDAVAAIGITNQRETVLLWERATGQPLGNAIGWQCRRTAAVCEKLAASGDSKKIRAKTGLLPDPYFSASKIAWLLDNTPGARKRARNGEILCGTIDSWLLWNLSGGLVHATDVSNASRTMLYNIHDLCWDKELLKIFNIPAAMLPQVKPSSGMFGLTRPGLFGSRQIALSGVAGDQQAALFGQGCFTAGSAKNTYGTGCFLLQNTGSQPQISQHKLLTTIAWQINGRTTYALEGSVFTAGAAIQWLRDEIGLISDAAQSEEHVREVPDTGGVYLVPAFTGLGAPYWNSSARGALLGVTRGTLRAHIVRAALESIAYQTKDVLDAMQADSGRRLRQLRADGGATANDFLMQFQADILGVPVLRPANIETTALGAAALAGLAVGFWKNRGELPAATSGRRLFKPSMSPSRRAQLYAGWQDAVRRVL